MINVLGGYIQPGEQILYIALRSSPELRRWCEVMKIRFSH